MPLTITPDQKKKAGMSLFPQKPGTGPSSHEFQSIFDPNRPSTETLGKFEPELMQMLRPQPTEDVEGKENLRKRARQNTLGRLLGSMAQLGGVAMGGDASPLQDGVNPYALQELETMRGIEMDQLAQYYDQVFNTGLQNNRMINDFRKQGRQMEFQDDQLGKRQDFSREQQENQFQFQDDQLGKRQGFQADEARKRAKDRIQQIQQQGKNFIDREMVRYGVDPNSKNAMQEITERMTQQFEKEMDRPHFAPRGGSGLTKQDIMDDPESMKFVRIGREIKLNQINQEINFLKNAPTFHENPELQVDPNEKEAQLKQLYERRKLYEQLDDEQVALDLYDIGKQTSQGDQQMGPPRPGQSPGMQGEINGNEGSLQNTQQETGNIQQEFNSILGEIIEGKFDNLSKAIEIIVQQKGVSEQEAFKMIKAYRDKNK